ncbi:hypothetical protein I5X18_002900 [Salmonella enterica]|nr:hypothetical protein [Salmonella enterica]EHM2355375.1 TcfC E-set like domain-containing protein [Salmonella enterica subsp. enterica serovar Bonariensis]HCZ1709239.1 TcfC E-set like domain-containing protein [Salmonella enterica subsp. enterica serovar Montevideo str. 0269]EFQ7323543.1 hypothetical protein [Salmonella enterica]EFQ7358123.1 hypothetical protein [Salmonella enterica]
MQGKISLFFIGVVIGICSYPAHARSSIPPGFEALSLGQNELLNVSFHGENEGVFTVFVTPETLTFKEPEALFSKLSLDGVSDDIKKKIRLDLSMPIPRHDKDFHLTPGKNIGAIYDEQEQSVMLLITPAWVKNNNQLFFPPNHDSHQALVSHQSLVFSHDGYMESLGGTGYLAQGVGSSSYMQGEWTLFQNAGKNTLSNSQFRFSNLYLRSDITPRIYSQIGQMDMTNLNSRLGGDFSLSLLPLSQIDGLRVGSTNAYINTESITTAATPLTVMLTQPARVDIYQGKQLLGSTYLMAGIHDIDTNSFPAGSYPVLLKIFQNGKLARQESQFFENSGRNQPAAGRTQWFFQAGNENTSNNYSDVSNLAKKKTQFAGGIQVGLSRRLSLTSALMGRGTDTPFSENALKWTLPSQAGIWSLKSSYLMKGRKGIADSEQLSWSYSNHALYLSRYHTFCKNRHSCYNNYGVTASTSLYGWTASLGYNYSHSAQRFLQPLVDEGYATPHVREFSPYSSQYVTSSMQLTLGTSKNYQGWNIWPRMGIFSNQSSGGNNHDDGVFLTVSLSKNTQSASNFSYNTTASLDYRQHSQDNNISLSQELVWNDQDYRMLNAMLSGGKRNQDTLVSAEWDSSLGNLGATFGYSHSKQYTNKAVSGHYDSTFAISSTGLAWGYGGGNESSLSGIIIDTKNGSGQSITGPIAKITSTQGGDAYIRDGRKIFFPTMDYMPDKINIEGSSAHGNNADLIYGAGVNNVFLLPGHIIINHLRANILYIYVGRVRINGKNSLAGSHILNANVPDINPDGSFVAEFNFAPTSLYLIKNKQIYSCPIRYKEELNNIRHVGLVNCHKTSTHDLPQTIIKSERLANLYSK